MSDDVVSGCLQHKDSAYVQVRRDFMDLYQNEHKAKIIRILETWTDSKRAEWFKANSDRIEQGQSIKEPDFWITMSYGQFKQFMYGSISEDTLKKNLTELEKDKHIKRRVHPEFPYGPPQYLLNAKVVQGALNKRATPSLVPELPQGDYLPPQEFTPTQGVILPPPRGENTHQPGGISTPTQGGKIGTSNNRGKNHLDNTKNAAKEREGISASASMPHASLAHDIETVIDEEDDPEATVKAPTPAALKVVPPSQHTSSQAREGKHERNDAAATVQGSEPRASEDVTQAKETAKQKKARLEKRQEDILALHCQLLGRTVVRSRDELEGARLMAESGATDEEITQTYNAYKDDAFWGKQLTLKNIAKLLDTTVTAKKRPLADMKPESFVSHTLDVERNERRINEMIEKSKKIRAERANHAETQ